jgi:hypothetical protein
MSEKMFDCPRCQGTGSWECISADDAPPEERFYTVEQCRACGGTGRVTQQRWDDWCDFLQQLPAQQ